MDETKNIENRLEELNKEYAKTKYNKATDKALGELLSKIAKTKKEIIESRKKKKGSGFFVKKIGDATVSLVGFPSAGKSSLLNRIANAKSKVAAYSFTTTTLIPGMLIYNDAHIQVFDLPGIIENAHAGAGGGRTVIAAAKDSDLILTIIDATAPNQIDQIMNEFKNLSIFVNKRMPDVRILDAESGLKIEVNKSRLNNKSVTEIFHSFGVYNSTVMINEDISEDELIAIVAGKARYKKVVGVLNKVDLVKNYQDIVEGISKKYNMEVIPVSVLTDFNINKLIEEIYRNLDIITVYLKPRMDAKNITPLVIKKDATVGDAARKLHTEIVDELKCAYVEGPSAKFKNQKMGANHVLKNGDIITFIKSR